MKPTNEILLKSYRLTKRKPDLRDRDHLPLSYVVVEGVSPEQAFRYLANRLRRR